MRSLVHVALPRTGLGNRMVPWARAVAFASRNDLPLLEPFWPQIKIGPLLRGERDSRLYLSEFRNVPGGFGAIGGGIARWALDVIRDPALDTRETPAGKLYVFYSYSAFFDGLETDRELISARLRMLVSPRRLREIAATPSPGIAIHVRRGDFPANWQSQSSWFRDTLRAVRAEHPGLGEARVFSDAPERDLADLLAEPDVTLSRASSAIVDMLTMSKAQILIASCHSSFSAWASFLGGAHTIVDSAQAFSVFQLHPGSFRVLEFDGTAPLRLTDKLPDPQ